MQKKKELPRKRKRHLRKVIFYSSLVATLLVILIGVAFYYLLIKFEKPLYVSPVSTTHLAQTNQEVIEEQEVEKDLQKDKITYSSVTKDDNSYIVTLADDSKVTFSSQKDIMTQIASLQYILSHLTMEGRQFSSLDLRFDQPVIVIKQ